jgi:hypothetical protein
VIPSNGLAVHRSVTPAQGERTIGSQWHVDPENDGVEPPPAAGEPGRPADLNDPTLRPPEWTLDWAYDSELRLIHRTGLAIDFDEPRQDEDNSVDPRTPRSRSLGDYSPGTVKTSQEKMQQAGASAIEAVHSTRRLLQQANYLFRTRRAGTSGAPHKLSKQQRLMALGQKRKDAQWAGYRGLGDVLGGAYECEFVSPLTRAGANVESQILVVLQDWGTEANLGAVVDPDVRRLGYSPGEPTIATLSSLLRAHFHRDLQDVYLTNLFPFIRNGPLAFGDLVRSATEFAIPQIDIVRPQVVVCLGLDTFNALRVGHGLPRLANLTAAAAAAFCIGASRVWSQAHTGYFGQMTRNRLDSSQVMRDWELMAQALRRGS